MNLSPAISKSQLSTKGQFRSFGIAGILNTLVDFLLLNFAAFVIGLPLLLANVISTSAAMLLSFLLNNRWVFAGNTVSKGRRIGLFLAVTLVGLYGIQSVVIYLLSNFVLWPSQMAVYFNQVLGLGMASEFVIANTIKLIATAVTLVWNFVLYKKVVFKR